MDDRLEAVGSLLLKNSSNSKTLGLTFCTRWLYPICLIVPSFDLAVLRKLFDFQDELLIHQFCSILSGCTFAYEGA
jgi:hypothetical protein